jgi:dipeptidyl aminopeptidase/acylaminoacyl peptidase
VKKDSPPTLILHGTNDTTVDRDQATELAAKLKEAGAVYEVMMIEGVGHTFDLQSWRRQPLPRDLRPVVIEFFDKHVKQAPGEAG